MTQAWFSIENRVNAQDIAETSATAKVPLGTRVKARHTTYGEGEFIYLKGVADTILGSAAHYNADDFSTALTVADAIGPIAIAMSANVADQYGWYQVHGKNLATAVAADVADNADLYLTATPGMLDDADVAGDHINGIKAASANATGGASTIETELWYPFTTNGADD